MRSGFDRSWRRWVRSMRVCLGPPTISAYVALLLLLYVHLLSYLDKFVAPLDSFELALRGCQHPHPCDVDARAAPALAPRRRLPSPRRALRRPAPRELEAILFVALAWWVSRARVRRALMVAPFVVVLRPLQPPTSRAYSACSSTPPPTTGSSSEVRSLARAPLCVSPAQDNQTSLSSGALPRDRGLGAQDPSPERGDPTGAAALQERERL